MTNVKLIIITVILAFVLVNLIYDRIVKSKEKIILDLTTRLETAENTIEEIKSDPNIRKILREKRIKSKKNHNQ